MRTDDWIAAVAAYYWALGFGYHAPLVAMLDQARLCGLGPLGYESALAQYIEWTDEWDTQARGRKLVVR